MTKCVTATQAQIRRNIKVARDAGLFIVGIRPDGTIVLSQGGENPLVPVDHCGLKPAGSDEGRWGD